LSRIDVRVLKVVRGSFPSAIQISENTKIGIKSMITIANLLGIFLALRVPEGGTAWMYLLLASIACVGAFVVGSRKRMHDRSND
jgi:hypothetical protein